MSRKVECKRPCSSNSNLVSLRRISKENSSGGGTSPAASAIALAGAEKAGASQGSSAQAAVAASAQSTGKHRPRELRLTAHSLNNRDESGQEDLPSNPEEKRVAKRVL